MACLRTLLTCSAVRALNSAANISFLPPPIRSAQDIQWVSLQLNRTEASRLSRPPRAGVFVFGPSVWLSSPRRTSVVRPESGENQGEKRAVRTVSLWDQAQAASDRRETDFPYHSRPTKAQARPAWLAFLAGDVSAALLSPRQIEPFTQAGRWLTHGPARRTTLLFEFRNQFVSNVHCNLFVDFEGNLAKINGNGLFSSSPLGRSRADKVLVKPMIVPVRAKVTKHV